MNMYQTRPVICCGFTPCVQRILEFQKFVPEEVNRAVRVSIGVGGKGANTARIIHQLGGQSVHLGFVGGENGQLFESLLVEECVKFNHVYVSEETRFCQTLVEMENPNVTELVEEMPALIPSEWDRMEDLFRSMDLSGIVTISGKLPQGAPLDAYARLVKSVNNQGGRIILDAQEEPLLEALKEAPYLVKINETELNQVAGSASDLLEKGAQSVLITNGSWPAMYISKDKQFKIVPPRIVAVNPVGSGDSVTAGLAYELSQNKVIEEAIITGMAAGAANALNLMCGVIKKNDVKQLRDQIKLQ